MNQYIPWRNILGSKKPDPRQKDVQLILRILALYHDIDNYQKPLRDFLSKFMSRNRNPSDEFLKTERLRFEKTCDSLIKYLGEKPFTPRGPLNSAVLDSVFVAFMKNLGAIPSDINKRFAQLMANLDFGSSIGQSTTDPEMVHSRLAIAEKILFE